MTLCFHSMGPVSQNQARRYISIKFTRWQYQLYVRQPVFSWSSSLECGTGAKYVIYKFLVRFAETTRQSWMVDFDPDVCMARDVHISRSLSVHKMRLTSTQWFRLLSSRHLAIHITHDQVHW